MIPHMCNSDDARLLLLIYFLVYLFNWYAHCLLREFQHSLALFIALPNLGISYWTPLLSPPHLHAYGQSELVPLWLGFEALLVVLPSPQLRSSSSACFGLTQPKLLAGFDTSLLSSRPVGHALSIPSMLTPLSTTHTAQQD